MLGPTGRVDTFTRDNLPPFEHWPEIDLASFDYPDRLNAGVELTDRMVERDFGDCTALSGNGRRREYVRDGWNLTGDSFVQDEERYFHLAVRSDDMIVSAGYNIAGPEVEAAPLSLANVRECAVIVAADGDRGSIVQAHVVLEADAVPSDAMVKLSQEHVKSVIAPYKYPRSIAFTKAPPKTEAGKMQRFRLKPDDRPAAR